MDFLVGSKSNYITIVPILLIMFLIETLKKGGFSKQSLSHFENIGGCVARLVLNKQIDKTIDRICEEEEKQFE